MTTFTEETEQDTPEETAAPEFHITTDAAANWLLRKLANIEAEQKRVTAQAAAIVAQLDSDRARLLHLYEGELLEYARQKLAEQGNRRRSLTLLQGSISFRSVPASVRVSDPFKALDYAQKAAPDLVRTHVSIDQAGFRDQAAKHLQETGELLPGVETTPAHETHRLSFGGKE